MWVHEHEATTTARPAEVWRVLADLPSWPSWDTSMESVRLLDPFGVGARVEMTPAGQEPITSVITRADADRCYADETVFAGLVLRFSHTLSPSGSGTRVVHRLEIDGDAATAAQVGPMIAEDFPEAMAGLLACAQAR